MLANNNNDIKKQKTFKSKDITYKKTNNLYAQPKIFNLIKACRNPGFKFGLVSLLIPIFFFGFYKNYILSVDLTLFLTLILLNYMIRPAVNNGIIKKVSDLTSFKMNTLYNANILIISSIYRLGYIIANQILIKILYNQNFNLQINTSIILITSIFSLIIISMYIFPRTLDVENNNKHMQTWYNNDIEKAIDDKRIDDYHNSLKREYKSYAYKTNYKSNNYSSLNNSNQSQNNTSKQNTKKQNNNTSGNTPEINVKKSDRRRRIF